ncbi:MAG: hypothetical protein KAH38_05390 [Candidatus Hydrogenedentes bacterium]|nr:hypothetical protein [Candidatus Hydrogenedentota bacterium]
MLHRISLLLVVCSVVWGTAMADDPYRRGAEDCCWDPVPDAVYLQETGLQIKTDSPVLSVARFQGTLYAVTAGALLELSNDQLIPVAEAPEGLQRIRVLDNALWGVGKTGLYRFDGYSLEQLSAEAFLDVCMLNGIVHAATRMEVYRYEKGSLLSVTPEGGFKSTNTTFIMEDGTQILPRPERLGPILRIAAYSGTLYCLRPNGVVLLNGDTVEPCIVDWGTLPSREMRDMLSVGSRLYIGTAHGIGVLRGMALTTLNGANGLPYEDITCITEGDAADIWFGTSWGAVRKVNGEFQYFAGQRWLPNDRVRDIAVGEDAVYIATDAGLGIIEYEPYTLQKKAAYYERYMEEWGFKRLGFVQKVWWNGEREEWVREITDNDGGYSSHYMVAMMYKYAVTGDTKALDEAINTFKSLVWLEEITPIEGFPARSIWSVGDIGEKSQHGSGGLPARWVSTPDGNFFWKGDTSSDEVGAHYYAMTIFCDLAPDGPEKDRAKLHVERLTRHIVENGFKLCDMDGELTRWARWNPEYLQRPYGLEARGLNGMEVQSYVHTAIGLLDDVYFRDALQQLIDWRYPEHTVRQKLTFPSDSIVPWDDRLAFMSYYSLLKFVESDALRSIYLRSLERSWEVKRIEKHPWFNFLYGIITGNDCEAVEGVEFLREWPLDLISYSYHNSHRTDLYPESGYVPYVVGPNTPSPKSISPRESEPKQLDATLLNLDGGAGGRGAISPNTWLETYWMGRYFGFIEAPETTVPALIGIEERPLRQLGAAPYEGPPRPF